MKVAKHWQYVSHGGGRCPIPRNIQGLLDGVLSNPILLKMSLSMAGGLDWATFKGLFQSSYDLLMDLKLG